MREPSVWERAKNVRMDALDFNYMHALSLFATTSKAGEIFESAEFLLVNNKGQLAEFNQAYLKRPAYKLPRALDRMSEHYARARVPFCLHARDDNPALIAELSARGFVARSGLPVMELAADVALDAPTPPGLRICRVEDARSLADLQRVAFESFGYPVALGPLALTETLVALSHVDFFVGYLGEQAVCCSGLIGTGEVAGVYWVGTLLGQRKLGLGAAITAHAVREGRRRGYARVCLQATEFGAPVYRRMGFRELHSYLRFNHG